MKRTIRKLGPVLATIVASAVALPAQGQVYFGQAVAVDGDSLEMTGTRIRLFGIDAVEARQTCDRGGVVWQCGLEAAAALRGLVDGNTISCTQRDIDVYGRIVAVCKAGGRDIAEAMVSMGLAVALTDFSKDYAASESAARQRGLGIWASTFQKPADYRRNDPASMQEHASMLAAEQRRQRSAQTAVVAPRPGTSQSYYRNCKEAWAAGAAPLHRGQPGYRAEMDGDGDGIACEPVRHR